jgi:DHA1 family multidrug resistance protein-like MFS transporter
MLSMYVLGYVSFTDYIKAYRKPQKLTRRQGVGPLIFSPMSEMPMVGRNVAYMSSFLIFIIMTAVASRVNNFPGLVVLRFIQGFFGGPVLATGAASAQDIFPFNKIPYALSVWAFFAYGGTCLYRF